MLQMTLRKRFMAGYTVSVFLILAVGLIAVYHTNSIRKEVDYLSGEIAETLRLTGQFESALRDMRAAVEKFVYFNREEDNSTAEEQIQKVLEILNSEGEKRNGNQNTEIYAQISELTQNYIEKYRNTVIRFHSLQELRQNLRSLGKEVQNELEKPGSAGTTAHRFDREFTEARIEFEKYLSSNNTDCAEKTVDITDGILEKIRVSGLENAQETGLLLEDFRDDLEGLVLVMRKMDEELEKELFPLAPRIISLAERISKFGWAEMTSAREEVRLSVKRMKLVIYCIIGPALLLGLLAGRISADRIISPLSKVIQGIMNIAEGDLRTRIAEMKSRDELAALVRAVNTMTEKMSQAVGASVRIAGELTDSVSQYGASVQETSASLEEMTAATRQNAEHADISDHMMNAVGELVRKTGKSVNELTETMTLITESSRKTSAIVKDIDGIAFQTNLLALNASIEAAKAGDEGRGFAVVASEVRNLSMRSAEAARNSSELIEETVGRIGEIDILVKRTDGILKELMGISAGAAERMSDISKASSEQARGIEQINKAVMQMDTLNQENADRAEKLHALMQMFRI